MSYDLLKDPSTESVALVDSELGRALGPVLSGPDAERIMEAFVGALGIDPAKLEHWEIQFRFNQYLEALQGEVTHELTPDTEEEPTGETTVPTVVESKPPADPTAVLSDGATGSASAPAGSPEAAAGAAEPVPTEAGASDGSGTTSAPATAGEGAGETGSEEPVEEPAGAAEPVRPTVPEGKVTCPHCDGWGTIAESGQVVPCPTCQGEGSVTQEVHDAYVRDHQVG